MPVTLKVLQCDPVSLFSHGLLYEFIDFATPMELMANKLCFLNLRQGKIKTKSPGNNFNINTALLTKFVRNLLPGSETFILQSTTQASGKDGRLLSVAKLCQYLPKQLNLSSASIVWESQGTVFPRYLLVLNALC